MSTDWKRVEAALRYLDELDVIAMGTHVVAQAQRLGPKEAYNEAGGARYRLTKARQHWAYLKETISSMSLKEQQDYLAILKETNEKRRALVDGKVKPDPDAMEE